jgi:hypothetical protein
MTTRRPTDAELEAAIRRYLRRLSLRLVPAAAALLALALVVALLPRSRGSQPAAAVGAQGSGASTPGGAGTSAPAGGAGSGTSGAAGGSPGAGALGAGALGAGGGPGLASTGAASSGTTRSGTASGVPGSPSSTVPTGHAVAVTGVACGPGAKQFSWPVYAPPCVPAFRGSNGGSTARGVTASTIALSFRLPNSTQQQAVNAFAGTANINTQAFLQDMQTYINFFNTQFELYGRRVVLKAFQGQGDYLAEDAGQDAAGAQADAETAAGLPAFADVTFPLFTSTYYLEDLARAGVIATGGLGEPDSWFAQFAPYEYSYAPTGTAGALAFGHLACTRMVGLPAIFSPAYRSTTRVLGLITPSNSQYVTVGREVEATLAKVCGARIRLYVQYDEGNVSQYETEAAEIAAEMKADGVTTVICGCDPIFPILMSYAADQQHYEPEWLAIGWGDPITRDYAQDQWDHAISNEGEYLPNAETEAYHVFLRASGGRPPAEQYYEAAYYMLLMVYDALQLAGPNLTPSSFAHGWMSMPETPLGQDGVWEGGPDAYSMADVTTQIGWWDPNATSNFDGGKGAWENCDGGRSFFINDPNGWGTPHTQLRCFGR